MKVLSILTGIVVLALVVVTVDCGCKAFIEWITDILSKREV